MGHFLVRQQERGPRAAFLVGLCCADFFQDGRLGEDGLVRCELIFVRADEDVEDGGCEDAGSVRCQRCPLWKTGGEEYSKERERGR